MTHLAIPPRACSTAEAHLVSVIGNEATALDADTSQRLAEGPAANPRVILLFVALGPVFDADERWL